MQLQPYINQVQSQLAAAAALGDESTRATADALATAAEAAVRLALLSAVAAAADEITTALLDSPASPAVSVRLDGDELRTEVRLSESRQADDDGGAGSSDDADNTARISLRLPKKVKAQVETAARRGGVSVNTWIVRAVAEAVSGSRGGWRGGGWEGGTGRHLAGWING